ncbi:MAG: fluoride efflux transporter CrcB [Cyclobacteriaceae bacterium]|nr:fluoride efflux transporter CrcB [Cyclobacteriaceae bacterium]
MKAFLLVGLGGFIGSICRYATSLLFVRVPSGFAWGTWTANIAGCLIIGIIYGFSEKFEWLTPEWRLFLATGFCGGYTTFSAFAYENLELLEAGNYWTFSVYSISSFAVGLLAVAAGVFLTKIL